MIQEMTLQDAMQEYQDNKLVITGNDGELFHHISLLNCLSQPAVKLKVLNVKKDRFVRAAADTVFAFFKENNGCAWWR